MKSRTVPASIALALIFCVAPPGPALASPAPPKQDFEARVDGYAPQKRAVLRAHLRRALSDLPDDARPFARAAAINAYVFQHVRITPRQGDGVSILHAGRGLCGGQATAMVELLHMTGIRSRHAALLGIPFQGNHSLVQAYFKGGRAGLFDPTFGVFWYSPRLKRPVPFQSLLRDPARSSRTLFKSVHRKREQAGDPVVPIRGVAHGYRLRHNYSEHATRRGQPSMDWREAFRVRGGAGLANTGVPIRARIRMRPGDSHGNEIWDGTTPSPWSRLIFSKDRTGLVLPWAFELGDASLGFKVMHSYRLRGLKAHRRYRLRLHMAQAHGVRLSARLVGFRRLSAGPVPELHTARAGQRVPVVDIRFTARRPAHRLALSARGHAMVQAISLAARP